MTYEFHTAQPHGPALNILLAPGLSSFCVEKFGQYDVTFAGCHTYGADIPRSFHTGDEIPLAINAVKHSNGIRILSDVKSTFKVLIEQRGAKRYISPSEEEQKLNGQFSYRYHFDLKHNERLLLTPESEIMLFTPAKAELIGADDCVEVCFIFRSNHSILFGFKFDFPSIECIYIQCGQRSHHKWKRDATNCRCENHAFVPTKYGIGRFASGHDCQWAI